ncbi:MAG: glutathione S-transferase [Gammaproteobacteria bacterium]|nr:glutathione S-transferase [Gammaproteobacteria bacterium]|tara:strand:- start:2414 stop:3049 length:636 start_codon:yes stop_codon:yes gene_type:complete
MKLYDSAMAPNPRRVRIFMAEKGVDYENIQIDIIKGENLDETFLAVNPRGLLPTLVLDDGTVIDETVAICRYIEETHPEPPLLGTDAVSKAHIEARQRHMEFDGLLGAADAFRNSFPGFSSRGLAGNAGSVDAIPALAERGKNTVLRFYESLDTALGSSTFIAGDSFSIADITALCTIDFATGAARVPIPEHCANVQRWHAEVSTRPSAEA